jgi:hypothetical protein
MAIDPFFIAERSRIDVALQSFQRTGELHDGFVTCYLDPKTGDEWLLYRLWDYHGSGPPCLRRRAEPSLGELLALIATTKSDAEVAAAVLYIKTQRGGHENYPALLASLEATLKDDPTPRKLRNILVALEWLAIEGNASNWRPIEGKSFEAIERDYQEAVALGKRAEALRVVAERRSGLTMDQDSGIFDR